MSETRGQDRGSWEWQVIAKVSEMSGKSLWMPAHNRAVDWAGFDTDAFFATQHAAGTSPEDAAILAIVEMARKGTLASRDKAMEFPQRPKDGSGKPLGMDPRRAAGSYLVVQMDWLVATYDPGYYLSLQEVLDDVLDRKVRDELDFPWDEDFAIWRDGRLVAIYHQRQQGEVKAITRFDEAGDDSGGSRHPIRPGWPTHQQWVDSGKGPLWYDPSNPENPVN